MDQASTGSTGEVISRIISRFTRGRAMAVIGVKRPLSGLSWVSAVLITAQNANQSQQINRIERLFDTKRSHENLVIDFSAARVFIWI
jgi:hypothetical protein